MAAAMNAKDILRREWEERVEGKFVFHGMSAKDLGDGLDPSADPFMLIRPKLDQLIEVLSSLVEAGFKFTVREEHFGHVCEQDLGLILRWTRNDLGNPGIDFTSSHGDACGYADCHQGSQLKQNFKYITDHLPDAKGDPIVREVMGKAEWSLVGEVNEWVSQESPEHWSVVIWVRRSCPAFDGHGKWSGFAALPVGSFECFCENVAGVLDDRGLPVSAQSVHEALPKEEDGFTVRMHRPLRREDIEKVDEVTSEKERSAPGPRFVG